MANPEHVALLKQGAEAWNRYRRESGATPNLNEADLSGVSMVGADLRDGVMFRTNFRGADLSRIKLAGTHLVEADLTDATLINADLARSFNT